MIGLAAVWPGLTTLPEIAVIGATLIVYLATSTRAFRHYGEANRYIEFALWLIPAFVLTKYAIIGNVPAIVWFAYAAWVGAVTLRQYRYWSSLSYPSSDVLSEFLAPLQLGRDSTIFAVPFSLGAAIHVRTHCRALMYQGSAVSLRLYEKFMEEIPFLKRDWQRLAAEFHVTHIISERSYLNVMKSLLGWEYDFSRIRKVAETDRYVAYRLDEPRQIDAQQTAVEFVLTLITSLIEKWPFARAMAARELKGANKGAILGIAWLVARPLIQVTVYTIMITYVFGARLGPNAGPYDYVLFLLSGLFGWQMLQRGLEDSTSLIRDRMEILKQVIYPIETLPVTTFLISSIGPLVILAVYLLMAAVAGKLSWTIVMLPLPISLLLLLLLGLSWIFMVIGVLFKDLREIIAVVLGLAIYISPVLLSPTMVPARVWKLMMLNPMSHVVIAFRDVFDGDFHPLSWAIFVTGAVVAFILGTLVITRAKVTINEYI